MQGWIKLHRKLLASPFFADPNYLKLWVLCLLKASHQPTRQLVGNQLIDLEVGQFVTGRHSIEEEFNKGIKPSKQLSESTLWRMLSRFESEQMLNIKKTTKYSVVTVVNWIQYQDLDSNWTANEQQLNTNKNVKNVKKKDLKRYSPFSAKKKAPSKEKKPDESEADLMPKDNCEAISEIIQYLNAKLDTRYRPSTKTIKEMINGRLNEGYTLDDFKYVIDVKCADWLGNVKMEKFLRPSTLFRPTNFVEYLNQKMPIAAEVDGGTLSKENERLLRKIQEEQANEKIGAYSDFDDSPKHLQ
ncbi:conserved phage C-terminal domain-containing protein [Paenibacillus ehimensis]|uniref:Conserved phage C-terminal domain-containing protein n=1 Tax=Paenibacillus ehimensis TaxID=79264 RepID=A0ABT8VIB3_9BACL|nr:conserved phage C-terminal domain-containing protein [Paenibacillus ehimensis]MDO3680679.1 conserved phage C-terminal domain-containing protein [Paenibacillus ehimensis]